MTLYLGISGVCIFCLVVLSRRWHWSWRIAALGAIAVAAFAIFIVLSQDQLILRGSDEKFFQSSPWKESILFAAMLCGMTSKYIWDLIEIRRRRNRTRKHGEPKYGLDFDFWDFIQPILVGGIVFSGVLAGNREMSIMMALFSFQNGFFWQSVLKSKVGKQN